MAAEKTCTGDCLRCSLQQQIYCAAQRSYAMMENQRSFAARLEEISHKLDGITNQEAIIPLGGAQNAGGADE